MRHPIQWLSADFKYNPSHCSMLRAWLLKVIGYHDPSFIVEQLHYIFCSDRYLLQLNTSFLSHDYYTDIITFDYTQGKNINAEVFISINRIKENAITYNEKFPIELRRVMAHGVLHILGYKDETKQQRSAMSQAEEDALRIYYHLKQEKIKHR